MMRSAERLDESEIPDWAGPLLLIVALAIMLTSSA